MAEGDGAVDDLLAFLTLRPEGDGWVGPPPSSPFGGLTIAQALVAASSGAPAGTRVHSVHAYFLRPVRLDVPLTYRRRDLRAGRTFTARRLEARQDDKAVVELSCSLTADDDEGDVYDLPGAEAMAPPEALEIEEGPPPWQVCRVGPSRPAPDGTRQSTHRIWFRIPCALPDDVHLHTALLGFATDWTGTGARPLRLEGDTTGIVSLDHAAWFHRTARVDTWLSFDVHSLVNAGGRGLLRGVIRQRDGLVVASVAQETRLAAPRG